jgi:hypothetical protein
MTRHHHVIVVVATVLMVMTATLLSMAQRNRLHASIVSVSGAHFTTGSVILVESSRHLHNHLTKLFTGFPITHMGVVFCDAVGHPFLFHTTRATGAELVHLPTWLDAVVNKSHNRVLYRQVQTPVSSACMETALTPFLGKPYSFNLWKAVFLDRLRLELPMGSEGGGEEGLFCSQLAATVLDRARVTDFKRLGLSSSALVLPHHFLDPSLPFNPTLQFTS